MKNILRESIDFTKYESCKADDLDVSVTKAALSRDNKVLSIDITSNFIILPAEMDVFRTRLRKSMRGIDRVDLDVDYRDPINKAELEKKREEAEQAALKAEGKGSGKSSQGHKSGGWNRKKKFVPAKGNMIMGSIPEMEVTRLEDVNSESGKVLVQGEIFKMDSITTRNDSKMAFIYITDKKTSIPIKSFMVNEKWDEISDLLGPGDSVLIHGHAQWDSYDNCVVVMADAIEKKDVAGRTDTWPEKRVELHAHTKMSAMDGLNNTERLIRNAEAWGHPAVAITDHGVVQAFPEAAEAAGDIRIIYGCEGYLLDDRGLIDDDGTIDYKARGTNHIIILVKNRKGLENLYRLVSLSHLDYFYKKPRIPRSVLDEHREGLILGSACEAGELFRAIIEDKPEEEIDFLAGYYDYFEIQPLINNSFLIDGGRIKGNADLMDLNRRIVELGEKYDKPVVATCDAHYFDAEEAIYRRILMAGQGYKDVEGDEGLYFRTTNEMMEEFSYLGEEKAYEVVIKNTNMIADQIESISPVPKGKFPPRIEGSEESLREACEERAADMYGSPLPEEIRTRLDRELNSIIDNGYAVMYRSAEMLVKKSLEDGYLVGSRGSVGSSFAATMSGITEVNPLPPHYLCPKCKNIEWGDLEEYDCGVDMPDRKCPVCGTEYLKEGFNIPFETFLGFNADKEPDIDLNFAGEYQGIAQKYVEDIFGAKNVFKAGTIGTIKDRTAYGYVAKYFEERGISVNRFEIDRLTACCEGVKKTTGQHPGGIIIVPEGHEIYEFCPVQHPANDVKSDIITTHFDYHSIDENLLKLDILGHDAPSMIRHLQDMTGVDPLTVPIKDPKVMSIFNGIEGLDIEDPDYDFTHGSYGIPEFGTPFVRKMLDDVKPTTFEELIRISGFSHGTDVWVGNARDIIVNGTATMNEAIATRDDIMNYLRKKGLPDSDAFKIMEKVRKGKGLTEEQEQLMMENDVPDWYIDSCKKIKYMFPRAHAVAYVIMSTRIAYYKVYHPLEFYSVYFTAKVDNFDEKTILQGKEAIRQRMGEIAGKGNDASKKEEAELPILEVAYEMCARGYEFAPARFGVSDATKFTVDEGKIVIPFVAISGMGEGAARSIKAGFDQQPYMTVEDVSLRGKVNKSAIEELRAHGALEGLPETAQISLF